MQHHRVQCLKQVQHQKMSSLDPYAPLPCHCFPPCLHVLPGVCCFLRCLSWEPAVCPLCSRLPHISLVWACWHSLLLVRVVLLHLLDGCVTLSIRDHCCSVLAAASSMPDPLLCQYLWRNGAVFGVVREAYISTVVTSACIAVPCACLCGSRH